MKIHVYDFDGTLFRNPPDTPENRAKFEKETGVPWVIDKSMARKLSVQQGKRVGMRRGWYGRAETLEPPLVPDPIPPEMWIEPTVKSFRASKADENVMTLVVTGRHSGIKNQVLRILTDGNLVRTNWNSGRYTVADSHVQCYFLGDNGPFPEKVGPKPHETLPWKLWLINQFLEVHDFEEIEIWEDREEHVESFREYGEGLPQEVTVNHVKGDE